MFVQLTSYYYSEIIYYSESLSPALNCGELWKSPQLVNFSTKMWNFVEFVSPQNSTKFHILRSQYQSLSQRLHKYPQKSTNIHKNPHYLCLYSLCIIGTQGHARLKQKFPWSSLAMNSTLTPHSTRTGRVYRRDSTSIPHSTKNPHYLCLYSLCIIGMSFQEILLRKQTQQSNKQQ